MLPDMASKKNKKIDVLNNLTIHYELQIKKLARISIVKLIYRFKVLPHSNN